MILGILIFLSGITMFKDIDIKDYNLDLQKLFVQFMITDPELYSRVRAIIDPKFFDRSMRKVVDLLVSHSEEYSTVPTPDIIKAQTGEDIEKLDNIIFISKET